MLAPTLAGCPGLDALDPLCQAGSLGGSIAASGFESVLSGISQWVASGAEWLLGQIGDVLSSTTTVDVGAGWFRTHYGDMTALAGVVVLPLLLASVVQAVLRQNPGQLVRTALVQLPLALVLAGVAMQVVVLSLSATDAMSDAMAGGSGGDVTSMLSGVTSGLVSAAADPSIAGFVLLLVGLLVAVAAFVLWLELLIRAAAVYVAVLFLPLALATLVWPAVSHWCRRLVETLAALILSKFVIVATLSLAAGALSSGTAGGGAHGSGFSAVLAGGALLVLATFVPFAILRLIPAVEAGAVGHLEGLRQRGSAALTRAPRSAAMHVLQEGLGAVSDARLLAESTLGAGGAPGAGGGAQSRGGALGAQHRGGALGAQHRGGALGAQSPDGAAHDRATGFGGHGESGGEWPEEIVGPNGETFDELLSRVTPENGGRVADAQGRYIGDPSSPRVFDETVARGVELSPRGPKPIVRRTPGGDAPAGGPTAAGLDAAGPTAALERAGPAAAGIERAALERAGSTASASLGSGSDSAAPPPRQLAAGWSGPPTGPARPEEAWKWQGVPPGKSLLGPVQAGRMRYYADHDDLGLVFRSLPPAWPDGEQPDGDDV